MINSITADWRDFVDEIKEETGETVILEEIEDDSNDDYLCILPEPELPIVTDGAIRSRLYTKSNIEGGVTTVSDIMVIYHPTYVIYRNSNDIMWHICCIEFYLDSARLSKQYKETIIDRLKFIIKESEDYSIAEDDKAPSDIYVQITLNPYNYIMN